MSPAPKMPGMSNLPGAIRGGGGGGLTTYHENEVDSSKSLWDRYEKVQVLDQEKHHLFEEILARYEGLYELYTAKCDAHERETEYARTVQNEKKEIEKENRAFRTCWERDPFVVILIDGDGMIFSDVLLNAGAMGGKQAADLLHGHMAHLIDATENIPRTAKIVTRVYANFKGLADICYKVGIIDDRCKIEEFARGFTRGRHLFDFVDVGPGKDRADEKIIETLKLYVGNIHCRQIFFGCSHDNGYARVLEEDAHDEFFNTRVTLLEGVPFEKELQELPFRTQKFEGLFRDTKILNPDRPTYGLPPSFPPAFNPQMGRQAMIAGNVNNTPGSSPYLSRNPSISTVASNDLSGFPALVPQPTTVTWANRAAAPPPPPKSPPPKFAPASSTPTTVPRNRAGQRVDPQSANYNKEEVNRVKNLKMCNVHFLRNECPFGAQCTHVHSYKPTRNELETLKLVARMAPCINGSSCDDIKCIYGHRCPAPDPKNGGSPAGGKSKTCIFADKCKFPPELHGIDTNVVKRIVIRN